MSTAYSPYSPYSLIPSLSMRHFGLIGKSLGHSFSRKYFSKKFEEEGIPAEYHLHELKDIAEFPALLRRQPDLRGLNVTIPYKTEVIPFLDSLSDEAQAVGAVNTIRIEQNQITGHNSDVYGFKVSLEAFLDGAEPSQALILGTGGAAKAVEYVLQTGFEMAYRFVSRTPAEDQFSYQELDDMDMKAYPLIINTTPLGMYPEITRSPSIPYQQIGGGHFIYDLIYNPEETAFMTKCKQSGARVCNGYHMLVLQAERSWAIWNELEDRD